MLSRAPVALRCTRISLDLAKRIRGPRAPERAIFALFSSWVAKFVIQPTALHCTSTLGDIIWRIRGASPPRVTIKTLFSAVPGQRPSKILKRFTEHKYHSQQGCPARRWRLVGPRYRSSEAGTRSVQGCPGRPRAHLQTDVRSCITATPSGIRTSLCDFGKRQTRASLQVDIVGVYECA